MNIKSLFIGAVLSILTFASNAAYINIDFTQQLNNYTPQFKTGTAEVKQNAFVMQEGNNWSALKGSFAIESDSILEINFWTTQLGEVHGIGFDNDTVFDNSELNNPFRFFQFAGTQRFGVQDFNNYQQQGEIQTFTIDLGRYFTGDFQYIVFINDNDDSPQVNVNSSYFQMGDMTPDALESIRVSAPGMAAISSVLMLVLMVRRFRS